MLLLQQWTKDRCKDTRLTEHAEVRRVDTVNGGFAVQAIELLPFDIVESFLRHRRASFHTLF